MGAPRLWVLLLLSARVVCVLSSPLTSDLAPPRPRYTFTNIGPSNDGNDPLISFWIANPEDGALTELPIEIRFGIKARNTKEFEAYYGDSHLCLELNGQHKHCKALEDPPIVYTSLPEGNYTATAYITDATETTYYHGTESTAFIVLSSAEYGMRNAQLAERSRVDQQFPEDIDLLQWAGREEHVNSQGSNEGELVLQRGHVSKTSSPMLVIGVKTAVVANFPRRQAIRGSWGDPSSLPSDVKVLFLGCEPNKANFQDDHDISRILEAVAKERAVYRDLLTEELGCTDAYKNLTDKVASFMRLAVAEFPEAKFMMVIDDDAFVKVDQLAENLREANRTGLYFGEVWAAMFGNKQAPIRDQSSQYYLPEDQYPMQVLLPYVAGPHSVMSMDGARFIAKNYWRLRSMSGLDDLSVGLWMWSTQMRPQHTQQFSSLRAALQCNDDLVSFADLSPLGIRSIHANLLHNRSFCHGFHSVTWHQRLTSTPTLEEMLLQTHSATESLPLQLETYTTTSDQVTVVISTPSNAGTKMLFTPSAESVDDFIQRLCIHLHQQHPASPSCQTLSEAVVTQLQRPQPASATSDGYM